MYNWKFYSMQKSYTFEDVHAQVKHKPHRPFLGFIVIAIFIAFIISLQQKNIAELAKKTFISKQLLPITSQEKDRAVKLTAFSKPPQDEKSTQELSTQEIVQRFKTVIYPREEILYKGKNRFEEYKKAGMKEHLLYEVDIAAFAGPANIISTTQQVKDCTQEQKNYLPETAITLTRMQGSLCEIHMSIATISAAFDHDFDPNTLPVNATEDWFLHKKQEDGSMGERLTYTTKETKDTYYIVNPANFQLRQYIIARLKKDLENTQATGVFLKNIDLSLANILKNTKINSTTDIFEFSTFQTQFADTTYADSLFYLISDINTSLNATTQQPLTLWGRFTAESNNGYEWDRYNGVLDGAVMNNFAINNGKPYTVQVIENQLLQLQKWQDAGQIGIANARGNSTDGASQAKYSLAMYLLVADGEKMSFSYSENTEAYKFQEYPEYYYSLGKPLEQRLKMPSDNPNITKYMRTFECGKVEVQLDESQENNVKPSSTISYNTGCIPGISPTPTVTPSLTATPTLIPTNTPLPTFTPFPTFTPIPTFTPVPTFTPAPLVCGWCGTECIPFDASRSCTMVMPPNNVECKPVIANGSASCQKVNKR